MKIPTYSRQADVNPAAFPMANPEALTVDLQAQRRFWAEGVEFGATNLRAMAYEQHRLQTERDAVDVVNAVSNFSDEERVYLTSLKSAPGRGMYDNAKGWYDETFQKYNGNFTSDLQRALFTQKVMSRRETGIDGVAKEEALFHAAQKADSFSAIFDSALKDAASFADNDERMQATIDEVFGGKKVDENGKAVTEPGWFDVLHPKKMDELERTKLKGEFISAVIGQLMLSDPAKADKYIEKYKADLGKSWLNRKRNVEQAKFAAIGVYVRVLEKPFVFNPGLQTR